MKRFAILLASALMAGCKESIRDPQAYISSLLEHPVLLRDGPFEYRMNKLPLDYFLAREMTLADSAAKTDVDRLRATVKSQHGGGEYFLLRIGLDSSSAGNPIFQDQMMAKMQELQSNQQRALSEITGLCRGKEMVRPDLVLINADWITKKGVSVLIGFKQEDAAGLTGIEFGKSFVGSRNLTVDAASLEPNFQFKG
jgi:hypothetical protein